MAKSANNHRIDYHAGQKIQLELAFPAAGSGEARDRPGAGTEAHAANAAHVEFSVSDIARSRRFYGEAFGWSFKDYGPGYCEFSDGRLTGGFALAGKGNPAGSGNAGGPLVILYASDLAETQRRLESVAAMIVKPPYSFPGGHRFHFADPDGYELAVWSDK